MDEREETLIVKVPKRAGLILEVQNIGNTDLWAIVEKGDLAEVVRKARLYDIAQQGKTEHPAAKRRWSEV
jgi:hypothetical protein